MRILLGLALIVLAIFLGLYVGVWLMFVGGIVQIINSFPHVTGLGVAIPVNALGIAIGIVKIFSASVVGFLSFLFPFAGGLAFLQSSKY